MYVTEIYAVWKRCVCIMVIVVDESERRQQAAYHKYLTHVALRLFH